MLRNMVTSLFKYDRIRTTDAKAKELRRWADNLVTLAKRGDLHARRQAMSIVREKGVVHKLFAEAADRFGSVSGGYTRVIKLGRRPGDAAPVSLVELIAVEKPVKKGRKKKAVASPVTKKAGGDKTKTSGGKADLAKTLKAEPESVETKTDSESDTATETVPVDEKKAVTDEASEKESTEQKDSPAGS